MRTPRLIVARPAKLAPALFAMLAVLAGCSSQSLGTNPLAQTPSAPLTQGAPSGVTAPDGTKRSPYRPKGKISFLESLKLQIDGKLPHPLDTRELKHWYDDLTRHPHQHVKAAGGGHVQTWVANDDSYLIGMTNKGAPVVATSTYSNGCENASTVKVDASRNVWLSCFYNSNDRGGGYAEYGPSGTFSKLYGWNAEQGCKPSAQYCYGYGYSYDGAANSANVFSLANDNYFEYCFYYNPSGSGYYNCYEDQSQGFYFWPSGSPSATPTYVPLWEYNDAPGSYTDTECQPVCNVDYMDLDASGNIWFDGEFCQYTSSSSNCGYGLGEVTNPTSSSRSISIALFFPASLGGEPDGGVYVSTSGGSQFVNVTVPDAREILQYKLPLGSNPKPNIIGPTPQNYSNCGDPISGAFGASGALVQGDGCGWVDRKNVGKPFKAITNFDIEYYDSGAAITPSDK